MNIKKLNKLEKRTRIIILIVYAVIMFTAIQTKISMITFIILFAVLPVVIYFYVKTIFPKNIT
jgi:hypothetical protein